MNHADYLLSSCKSPESVVAHIITSFSDYCNTKTCLFRENAHAASLEKTVMQISLPADCSSKSESDCGRLSSEDLAGSLTCSALLARRADLGFRTTFYMWSSRNVIALESKKPWSVRGISTKLRKHCTFNHGARIPGKAQRTAHLLEPGH